ncbi:hypothetical protein Salat_1934600 [Sesamum alatum]|uniref:Uncharacterized protein n=1 Tax=Sesamum alatum TaxID=300844 RepID=A0AAE1Y4G5_9LAMI|nr:hypothetical protein Salat_1934600 [Sesamum alatum]
MRGSELDGVSLRGNGRRGRGSLHGCTGFVGSKRKPPSSLHSGLGGRPPKRLASNSKPRRFPRQLQRFRLVLQNVLKLSLTRGRVGGSGMRCVLSLQSSNVILKCLSFGADIIFGALVNV